MDDDGRTDRGEQRTGMPLPEQRPQMFRWEHRAEIPLAL
ncbi:MAG: hypothetical protein QOC85_1721, partial [Streptomyces sp.]|nr:hypothetical protein [Streptomyces sp.]